MVGTAQQAAREFEGRVTVVDSLSLSLGLGFQALAAAEAAENGLEAALAAVELTRTAAARLCGAGHARIRPSQRTRAGDAVDLRRRAASQATDRIGGRRDQSHRRGAHHVTGGSAHGGLLPLGRRFERLAIMHSNAESRARTFLDQIMREYGQSLPRDILMVNVTPVIGTHVGPNALGFAAVRA